MAADLYRSALVQQTRAALHAIEQAVRAGSRPTWDTATALLERWGDALRLGELVPSVLRNEAARIEQGVLAEAIRSRTAEVESWTVPGPEAGADDRLEFVLWRRDETESLLQGLTRLMLDRHGLPSDVAGLEILCDALAQFDSALSRHVDRRRAEAAIGIRVALHDDRTWLASLSLPEPTGVAETLRGMEPQRGDADAGESPSDAIVHRYASRGALRGYVEGYAARDPEFTADLVDVVDQLQGAGEPVSLVAAVWRKRQGGVSVTRNPVRYGFVVDRREAAATPSVIAAELQRQELGPLPGVAAEAALEYRGQEIALIVYPERAMKQVAFGETEGAGPESDGTWIVRVRVGALGAGVRVLVVDDAGNRFEETMEIELR